MLVGLRPFFYLQIRIVSIRVQSGLISAPSENSVARVVFVHRRASGAQLSIERLFGQLREAMGESVSSRIHIAPHAGGGILRRVANLLAARRACGGSVIAHITGDVHYLALGLAGKRTVLTIHDCGVLHRLGGWRRAIVRKLWYEWPVRRAAVVTTISEATKRDLSNWLPQGAAAKIRVVPNCVGPEFIPSTKVFDEKSPHFLQVGAGWNKNLERVVEALEGTGARLTVVGPVDPARQRRLTEGGVAVRFLGRINDDQLVRVYQDCDALIFASLFEGFGMPIVEAQATGRPVITSNRSAMPEVAGKGALLVDPEDVDAIRSAIIRLRDDAGLRGRLVEDGFLNVARFRAETIAGQYLEIYRELAAGI